MAQAQIGLLTPQHDIKYDIYLPISKADIQEGLRQHPDAEAVYITSPTFEGLICNYKEIREVIGYDRILIVDEAHGSHLYFNKDSDAIQGALQSDAVDVCITSVHKNLGSLSGTALINIGKSSRLSADLVKEIYIMLSTTSPSPYLLFDVEGCVRLMLD